MKINIQYNDFLNVTFNKFFQYQKYTKIIYNIFDNINNHLDLKNKYVIEDIIYDYDLKNLMGEIDIKVNIINIPKTYMFFEGLICFDLELENIKAINIPSIWRVNCSFSINNELYKEASNYVLPHFTRKLTNLVTLIIDDYNQFTLFINNNNNFSYIE